MTPLVEKHHELTVSAEGQVMADVTQKIASWLKSFDARDGLLTVFLRHASASLAIQENTPPSARADLIGALSRFATEGSGYGHNCDGSGDMPAHIKAILTSVSLSIPVFKCAMALGAWQGIYLIEHRKRATPRAVMLHFVGSCS